MSAGGGVTAEELIRSLRRRQAALPAEIGTFVVFEACEAMLSRSPLVATLSNLSISDEGAVSLPSAERADQESAARSLHTLLTSLLVAAGPAPTPALLRLAEEGPLDGRWTLDQMRDDLEAALVPLNRTASRRVLARLVRETGRGDKPSGRPQPKPKFNDLDEELSDLLGVERQPTREPPEEQIKANVRDEDNTQPRQRRDDTVREPVNRVSADDDDIRFFDAPAASRASAVEPRTIVDNRAPAMESVPSVPQLRGLDSLSERAPRMSMPPVRTKSALGGVGLVVLAVGLLGAILVLRPDALQRLRGETPAAEQPKPKPAPPAAPVGGDLVVRVATERAQILRFVGRGPVTVPNLPLGVAHEFVALADGASPTRVLVPADAEWERTPEGPRYEFAMQAGPAEKAGVAVDFGDTLLPQNVGTPRSELGSVRIVTTPRGAKVYQVIGFAPEARIQDLTLDHTEELLVWKAGHEPLTRVVSPSDFIPQGGRKVAELSLTLALAAKPKNHQ